MHESVLVIGASNEDELEKILDPFYQIDCTMDQDEMKNDPRASFYIEYTNEEAEKKYQEEIKGLPTKEQIKFFQDNFMEKSDKKTCQEMYIAKGKKKTRYAPDCYIGNDFAYGSTTGYNGKGYFFLISEEKMIEARKWVEENELKFWNLTSPRDKKDFLDKYPDIDTFMIDSHQYEKDKNKQGYGYYHNPNGFWDWYQVGGRWIGFFKIKTEKKEKVSLGSPSLLMHITDEDIEELKTRADALTIEDIDFESMNLLAKKTASEQWDRFREMLFDDKISEGKTTEEREEKFRRILGSPEGETKEEYIERNKNFNVSSIVYDGIWYEKQWENGKSIKGYIAKNKGIDKKIEEELPEFLQKLDKSTSLILVDCHR